MKPLIDADVLVYECAYCGQGKDDDGELEIRSFDTVSDILDQRIKDICFKVGGTEAPRLYLTGKGNFREKLATTKPYKGTRKQEKPFHYKNITYYMLAHYDCVMVEGMEADDQMCIDQCAAEPDTTIICTRDKDLRMCPGWHYGWECGLQPEFGPEKVEGLGYLKGHYDDRGRIKKLSGVGLKFFYSQLITGDSVDNIPGLPKGGPKLALSLLEHLTTEEEMFLAVCDLYKEKVGDTWKDYLLEQGRLLWMVLHTDDEGEPVMWEPPW